MQPKSQAIAIIECALSAVPFESAAFMSKVATLVQSLVPSTPSQSEDEVRMAVRVFRSLSLRALPEHPKDLRELLRRTADFDQAKAQSWARSVLDRCAGLNTPQWECISNALKQLLAASQPDGAASELCESAIDFSSVIENEDVELDLFDDDDDELDLTDDIKNEGHLGGGDTDRASTAAEGDAAIARALACEFDLDPGPEEDLGTDDSPSAVDLRDDFMTESHSTR